MRERAPDASKTTDDGRGQSNTQLFPTNAFLTLVRHPVVWGKGKRPLQVLSLQSLFFSNYLLCSLLRHYAREEFFLGKVVSNLVEIGPTDARKAKAQGNYTQAGRGRSQQRFTMYDDALGRAWRAKKITDEEYAALGRYAYHWACGGLQGAMQSVDPDRILAFSPSTMSGLARSERQADHRAAYHAARVAIGTRPAFVADSVACYDIRLLDVGQMLGYLSHAHARDRARELLADAGYRLAQFWKDRDRR